MKALSNRDVGWKALLPGAVVGAVGFEVLKLVGSVYVPRLVASSSALYGSLGVVFAILAWLLFFGRLIVYSAVVNVVRWEEDHGTVTVDLPVPKVPGEVPTEATRAGEVDATRRRRDEARITARRRPYSRPGDHRRPLRLVDVAHHRRPRWWSRPSPSGRWWSTAPTSTGTRAGRPRAAGR